MKLQKQVEVLSFYPGLAQSDLGEILILKRPIDVDSLCILTAIVDVAPRIDAGQNVQIDAPLQTLRIRLEELQQCQVPCWLVAMHTCTQQPTLRGSGISGRGQVIEGIPLDVADDSSCVDRPQESFVTIDQLAEIAQLGGGHPASIQIGLAHAICPFSCVTRR